jgi:hypothetical protein
MHQGCLDPCEDDLMIAVVLTVAIGWVIHLSTKHWQEWMEGMAHPVQVALPIVVPYLCSPTSCQLRKARECHVRDL